MNDRDPSGDDQDPSRSEVSPDDTDRGGYETAIGALTGTGIGDEVRAVREQHRTEWKRSAHQFMDDED